MERRKHLVWMSHCTRGEFLHVSMQQLHQAQLHLNKTKSREAVAHLSMRVGALCHHDIRRRLWMQQATQSTLSIDWRGRVGEKERERRKHREQKSHIGSQQEGYSNHRAVDGKYNTNAALSPPLSKLGKLLRKQSMPSTPLRSLTLIYTDSWHISTQPHPPAKTTSCSQHHSSYTKMLHVQ